MLLRLDGRGALWRYPIAILLLAPSVIIGACSSEKLRPTPLAGERANKHVSQTELSNKSGGSLSIANRGSHVLQRPQPNLSAEQQLDWSVGKSFATQAWVTAPATTTSRDGLGPLFNANNCTGCHVRNGQGQIPEKGLGLILRLNDIEALSSSYGEQLQDMANPGSRSEGRIDWTSFNTELSLANGQQYVLHHRKYAIDAGEKANTLNHGKDATKIHVSARLAPALIGMGLLDHISVEDILANSDPDDLDRDGISGRANFRKTEQGDITTLGRFGWKASQSSLYEQVALAFFQDMGITSSIHPSAPCSNCDTTAAKKSEPEISDKLLLAVTDYIANLAVPEAAHTALSQEGFTVFKQLGCAACHTPTFTINVAKRAAKNTDSEQKSALVHSNAEVIYPFSDLLLHNMGDALADVLSSDNTPANEWRTAPLWGLGIRSENPDTTRLLHDGRARSITEAILWHGGEAEVSKARFTQLADAELSALLHFLKAL